MFSIRAKVARKSALWMACPILLGLGGCWRDMGQDCVQRCSHLQDSRECYRDCHYGQ
jgi:hypothetical protein